MLSLTGCDLVFIVDGLRDKDVPTTDIRPAEAYQFARTEAGENLEAVSVDERIDGTLALSDGGVLPEEERHVLWLQDVLLAALRGLRDREIFRAQGSELALAAVLDEVHQRGADVLQRLLGEILCVIGFGDDGLQMTLVHITDLALAKNRLDPDAAQRFVRGPMRLRCGLLQLFDVFIEQAIYPNVGITDAVIQPSIRLGMAHALSGSTRSSAGERLPLAVLLDVDLPAAVLRQPDSDGRSLHKNSPFFQQMGMIE